MRKKRRVLITHTDLDGAGCQVIFCRAFGIPDDIYSVNHDRIDQTVRKVVGNLSSTDRNILWITDIAPSREVMDLLKDLFDKDMFEDLMVCDHHKTTQDYLCNVSYANFACCVDSHCATHSVAREAIEELHLIDDPDEDIMRFALAVDAYDLWKLDSEFRERGENLNKLLKVYGFQRFVAKAVLDINFDSDHHNRELIEVMDQKMDNSIKARIASLKRDNVAPREDGNGNKYVVVLDDTSDLTSQLGHAMLENFDDIDYAVIARANGVISLRSRDGGVDVGAIAKKLGGGGHAGAAGFSIKTRPVFESLMHATIGLVTKKS